MNEFENSEGFEIDQRFEHPSFLKYFSLPDQVINRAILDVHFPDFLNNIAILKLKNKISFDEKVKPAVFFRDNRVNRTELRFLTAVGFTSDSKFLKKVGNLNESLPDNYTLFDDSEKDLFEGSISAETDPGLAGKCK